MDDLTEKLFRAVLSGNRRFVIELLDAAPSLINVVYAQTGDTLLHVAARQGHIEIGRTLVQRGLDVKCTDNHGDTPLERAVWYGHLEMARELLVWGADPNRKNNLGLTPFQGVKNSDMAAVLLDGGADIAVKYKNGATIVTITQRQSGDTELVEFLQICLGVAQRGAKIPDGTYSDLLKARRVSGTLGLSIQEEINALAQAIGDPRSTTFCPSCGAKVVQGAKFCHNCGSGINATGSTGIPQPSRRGRWQYREFHEPLGNVTIKDSFVFAGLNASGSMDSRQSQVIEAGVRRLIDRISVDGWEPAEAIDVRALALAGHVEWESEEHESILKAFTSPSSVVTNVTLLSVRVNFRRWVT
jgi:uncharacterized protein YjhX (UPF0386 family)